MINEKELNVFDPIYAGEGGQQVAERIHHAFGLLANEIDGLGVKVSDIEKKVNDIISGGGVIEDNVLGGGHADTTFDSALGGTDASL